MRSDSRSRIGARRSLCVALACLGACADPPAATTPPLPLSPQLASLGVEIDAKASRSFIYTDKGDAFFWGEAAGPHQSSWQGLNVRGFNFVDDWQWIVGGKNLGSSAFTGATVLPDHAERRYPGGLAERVTLIDNERALLVEPSGSGALTLRPLCSDSTKGTYYQTNATGGALQIARANHLTQNGEGDFPVWLVVKARGGTASVDPQLLEAGGLKPKMLSPGALALATPEPIVLAVGKTLEEATATADRVLASAAMFKAARATRMQALLDDSYVKSEHDEVTRAIAWIRLSMDALVMNQQGRGIFAGIPWFNNYWGRDTFLTLGGSHLATGRWEEAKEILLSFAAHQDADDKSPTYGRIPNTVSLGGTSYNTADGTPWFVIQAAEYLKRTGDQAFARAIWPVIQRASDGALRHVDDKGYLKHGDQETWMDANGPNGPYTPRGDRAVDIQALFYQQQLAAAFIADRLEQSVVAAPWRAAADKVKAAFFADYYDVLREALDDRLQPDGTRDVSMRPNMLTALHLLGDVIPADKRISITRSAAERLAYKHGVASLSPLEDRFHPYHILAGYYPKDEAYHNGVVWGWLSGPLVSLMVAQDMGDKAWEQLQSLGDLALLRGPVGTLPELMDALPRLKPGVTPPALGSDPPQPAGTPFQAWSHGEYLRNVYEDFLGVRYQGPSAVTLSPHVPAAWGRTTARFRVGTGAVRATLTPSEGALTVELLAEGKDPVTVTLQALGQTRDLALTAGTAQTVTLTGSAPAPSEVWKSFDWRPLTLPKDLPALQFPGFVVLDHAAIKQGPGADVRTRVAIDDVKGDDTGPPGSAYTYPTDVHFAPSIADLRRIEVREDKDAFFFAITFENLVQPGWNPADGFQLTYAALLFDTGAMGQRTEVGHKAQYTMPPGTGYSWAIYIGAGFEIEDKDAHLVGTYKPEAADVIDPLGSVDTRTISFRVPKSVIPSLPEGTKLTVLAGSQDDYGTGIMGDFRVVSDTPGQWVGGGKKVGSDPNVYDFAMGTLGP